MKEIESVSDFDREFANSEWIAAAMEVCRGHSLRTDAAVRAGGSEHVVVLVGDSYVVKFFRPDRGCFEREAAALEFVGSRAPFPVPEIVRKGQFRGLDYLVLTQVGGEFVTRGDWLGLTDSERSGFIRRLGADLRRFHGLGARTSDWASFVAERADTLIARQEAAGVNRAVLEALPGYLEESLTLVPTDCAGTFMHADIHFGNLRIVRRNGRIEIAGLFDFADSRSGFHEYEFLAVGVLMIQGQGELQRELFRAYGYKATDLDEEMRRRLMMLTMLYETADLRRYAMRLAPEAVDWPLERLERGIWSFVGC